MQDKRSSAAGRRFFTRSGRPGKRNAFVRVSLCVSVAKKSFVQADRNGVGHRHTRTPKLSGSLGNFLGISFHFGRHKNRRHRTPLLFIPADLAVWFFDCLIMRRFEYPSCSFDGIVQIEPIISMYRKALPVRVIPEPSLSAEDLRCVQNASHCW